MLFNDHFWVISPNKEERVFLNGDYGIKFLEDKKKYWFINILYRKDVWFIYQHERFIRALSKYIYTLNKLLYIKHSLSFEQKIYKKYFDLGDKKIIIEGPFTSSEEKYILLRKSKQNNDFVLEADDIYNVIPNKIKLYDPIEYFTHHDDCHKIISNNLYIFKMIDKNSKSLLTLGLYR